MPGDSVWMSQMTLRIDLLQVQLAGKQEAKSVKSPAAIRTVTRLKHDALFVARRERAGPLQDGR
jgi:hypothetical protein